MNKPIFKKVSKAGGFTIPQQIRHTLNIPKGAPVEVRTTPDNEIIIKKHVPTCLVCGTADHVKVVNGIELCVECAGKFKEKEDDVNDSDRN